MSTYEKTIFLFFKKGLSIREIVDIIPDELTRYRHLAAKYGMMTKWETVEDVLCHPVEAAQKIIGNEIATMFLLGNENEYQNLRAAVFKMAEKELIPNF